MARDGKGRVDYLPPEGVPIRFAIASIGSRFGALLLDILITYGSVILFSTLLVSSGVVSYEAEFTLIILLVFLIRVPYYILSELIWNGRTLGKRIVGIRVINADGRRLTPHQVAARNLMKEVEFFTPATMLFAAATLAPTEVLVMLAWITVIVIVPFANKRRQRIGDIIAGTLVVQHPRHALLPDIAASQTIPGWETPEFEFVPEHLGIYGRFELQTLEQVLRNLHNKPGEDAELDKIARTIITRIGYTEPVKPGKERSFLRAFYRAQREHLETLRLFGTKRENKFHDSASASREAEPPPRRGR